MAVHMLHSSGQSLGDKELRLTAMSFVHLIEVTHVALTDALLHDHRADSPGS